MMNLTRAPYGTWLSPIAAEAITRDSIQISDVLVDPITSTIYHVERRPFEGGRGVLVQTESGNDVTEAHKWNVRSGVHEYGGAAAVVHGEVAYFSHYADGRVYRVDVSADDKVPEGVTPEDKPYRFAAFDVHPIQTHLLVSVLEDHTHEMPDVVNTLCIINTTMKTVHSLVSGADFYASPTFSPDGTRVSWMQWSHPDMPWESGEIRVGIVSISQDDTVMVMNDIHIVGKKQSVSTSYPSWANNDTLLFTSDQFGYINPLKYDFKSKSVGPLFFQSLPLDFGRPLKVLNWFPYAVLDEEGTKVIWSALKDGRDVFYLFDLTSNTEPPQVIYTPFVGVQVLRTRSRKAQDIVFVGQCVDQKSQVVKCPVSSLMQGHFQVLKNAASNELRFPAGVISSPQPMTLLFNGAPLHLIYYPPTNAEYAGSSVDNEKPPCVVNAHGGPTGFASQALDWNVQYFTSRGWGWLEVNYSGSYGYGRSYRERLAGNWGIFDVNECIFAARTVSADPYNLADPARLVIRGSSAGGFTALAALSTVKDADLRVFAAATCLYGISDLKKLAELSHKFESHYLYKLVGGMWEEVPEVYKARSPVLHADRIQVPFLLLQGDIDPVVPKLQSDAIYEMVRSLGGAVEYHLYPGEGHGWRREETMRDALERELDFYKRVLGLKGRGALED